MREVTLKNERQTTKYIFNKVFGPESSQIDLYKHVIAPIVDAPIVCLKHDINRVTTDTVLLQYLTTAMGKLAPGRPSQWKGNGHLRELCRWSRFVKSVLLVLL